MTKQLLLDSIIFKLQSHGGITQFWNALVLRLRAQTEFSVAEISGRSIARYAPLWKRGSLFHSSYYRSNWYPRCRNVVTVYDFIYEKGLSGSRFAALHIAQKRYAIKRADAVVCISESTRQDMLDLYPEVESRSHVIHLAAAEWGTDPGRAKSFTDVQKGCYFLFTGHRYGYKQFDFFLNAFVQSGLAKQGFSIVCTGAPFSALELRLFSELGLSECVYSFDRAASGEMKVLYENAAALAYPSLYEGFGLPIVEAMRAGCPVIACRTSSIPEVGGDAVVLVEKTDSAGFAEALKAVVESRERSRLGALGRVRAELFSWDRTVASYISVYRSLARL